MLNGFLIQLHIETLYSLPLETNNLESKHSLYQKATMSTLTKEHKEKRKKERSFFTEAQ